MSFCRELTCPHHGPANRQRLVAYRGTLPAWEAPANAVQSRCPVGLCVWYEVWDTVEELNEAKLRHVRDDHGEADPEIAILRAHIRSEVESHRRNHW